MSPQRLELVAAIRNAAATLVNTLGGEDACPSVLGASVAFGDLTISVNDFGGGLVFDIWEPRKKVFSIRQFTDADELVTFRNGPWVETLLSSPALRVLH